MITDIGRLILRHYMAVTTVTVTDLSLIFFKCEILFFPL